MRLTRFLGTLLLLASTLVCAPRAQQVRHVQQQIDDGMLEGVVSPDDKVRTFKGIPYAAPPIGRLRWRAPEPVRPWPGVQMAVDYPARCMQGPPPPDIVVNDKGPSEDCLYLNLWMPAHPQVAKLPVMVWINGEQFTFGSSSEPRQDAGNLSKKGVLVVSFNYRLGVFGFFALPKTATDRNRSSSGNEGLLDQLAALRWVKKNIGRFGGDPDNVTIFGAGSGSVSVSALMASPSAQGLFQKAIGEGGSCLAPPLRSRQDAEKADAAFAQAAFGSTSLEALRALSADKLLDAALTQPATAFSPEIDGVFLPGSCDLTYRKGKQSHVPLLAGWNDGGTRAGAIGTATKEWIDLQNRNGHSNVFVYQFDQVLPIPAQASGTTTTMPEIEFVFRVLSSKPLPWRPEDRELSETISSYWTNFAKTGDPNGPGLPIWQKYTAASLKALIHLRSGSVPTD